MGQKAHPVGNRLGIIRGWDSNWYGGKNYADRLVEDEKIRIYPNPANENVFISLPVAETELKLYDMTGRIIRKDFISGTFQNISLENILPGIYLVQVRSTSGEMGRKKLIVR